MKLKRTAGAYPTQDKLQLERFRLMQTAKYKEKEIERED